MHLHPTKRLRAHEFSRCADREPLFLSSAGWGDPIRDIRTPSYDELFLSGLTEQVRPLKFLAA